MENDIEIEQIYRIDMTMPLIIERYGRISDGTFIDYRSTSITSQRRRKLLGHRLKASMVVTNNDTLNHLTDYQ